MKKPWKLFLLLSCVSYQANAFFNFSVTPKILFVPVSSDLSEQRIAEGLRYGAKSSQIDAIILVINSGGGGAGYFSVLHDLVKKVSSFKPVIALIESGAISGGYMVASAAHYIIAYSGASVGGIGVLSHVERVHDSKLNQGVKGKLNVEVLSCGSYKALHDIYSKELTDEERAYLQEQLKLFYEYFKELVADNRKISLEESDEWAEGKTFLAREALEKGLIDEVGTIFEAEVKIVDLLYAFYPGKSFSQGFLEYRWQ